MPGPKQIDFGKASAEKLYRDNLELVERAISFVARSMHLPEEDREDFASSVHLKLIENDYRVFRRFQGTCQLKTYLVTVIKRHGIDLRNKRWGRWRPSTMAKRMGEKAVALETLTARDGHPYSEAITILVAKGAASEAELEEIASRLPVRYRRQYKSAEGLEAHPDKNPTPAEQLEESEEAELQEQIFVSIKALSRELDPQDRLILRMNFEDNVSVADMARVMGLNQRRLYAQRDRILTRLRRGLDSKGFSRQAVMRILGEN